MKGFRQKVRPKILFTFIYLLNALLIMKVRKISFKCDLE